MSDVQLVTHASLGAAARTMAAAFVDDPVWRYLVPHDRTWERHAHRLFGADLANRLRHGYVYATGGMESVAGWSPPDTWRPSLAALARESPSAVRLFGTGLPHALRVLSRIEAVHPHGPPHWYLGELGTAPDQQRKGFASRALAPILRRCDKQGLPAYLESSKEQNLAFYARHGFVESEPLVVFDDAPPVWPMWREPRSA